MVDLVETPWLNLKTLTLRGPVSTLDLLGFAGFAKAGLDERRFTVVLDLCRMKDGSRLGSQRFLAARQELVVDLSTDPVANLLNSSRLVQIVIRIPRKEEEEEIRQEIELGWWENDETVQEEWRSRMRFEVW